MSESDKKRKLSGANIFLILFFILITVVAILAWQYPGGNILMLVMHYP